MITRSKKIRIVIYMLITCFYIIGCIPSYEPVFTEPQIVHEINVLRNIELLWTLENIYVMQNDFESGLSAFNNVTCFLGDNSFPPMHSISCIDSISKEVMWQKSKGTTAGIILLNEEVYVSYYGIPGFVKYNNKGEELWDYSVSGILYMYIKIKYNFL